MVLSFLWWVAILYFAALLVAVIVAPFYPQPPAKPPVVGLKPSDARIVRGVLGNAIKPKE